MSARQDDTLTAEIAQLDGLGLGALRDLWRQRLGSPPRFASTEVTRLWLAWELQAQARGGYDSATRRRLRLGNSAETKAAPKSTSSMALKPGTVLTREWAGVTHRVMVLEEGFGWAGQPPEPAGVLRGAWAGSEALRKLASEVQGGTGGAAEAAVPSGRSVKSYDRSYDGTYD